MLFVLLGRSTASYGPSGDGPGDVWGIARRHSRKGEGNTPSGAPRKVDGKSRTHREALG